MLILDWRYTYIFFTYSGTGETVKNIQYLLSINVTHVLNTAECDVNVNPKRYTKEGICYKGFRVPDVPHADIAQVVGLITFLLSTTLIPQFSKFCFSSLKNLLNSSTVHWAFLMASSSSTVCWVTPGPRPSWQPTWWRRRTCQQQRHSCTSERRVRSSPMWDFCNSWDGWMMSFVLNVTEKSER